MTKEMLIKEINYRSKNRGVKELDITLGKFVQSQLKGMNEQELKDLIVLLKEIDLYLWDWLSGGKIPDNKNTPMLQRVKKFMQEGGCV